MNSRQIETLNELRAAVDNHMKYGLSEFVRPMDCGGSNGSHHSATLAKLVKLGFAKRRKRSPWAMSRGSWSYTITDQGRAYLALSE